MKKFLFERIRIILRPAKIPSADQLTGLCMVRVFEKSDFQIIHCVTDFLQFWRHIVKLKTLFKGTQMLT